MAMKKRFLPALMAGMVVVGSTGLVNADTPSQTITGNTGETLTAPVHVSGTVSNNKGIAPGGKLTVELPTKMTFAVDKEGAFKGGTYEIRNSSQDTIGVSVSSFIQTSGNIEVVDAITDNSNRGEVCLALRGNFDDVDLIPDMTMETKISEINGNGGVDTINLIGEAGKAKDEEIDKNGATGEFNMIFKINKVESSDAVVSSSK